MSVCHELSNVFLCDYIVIWENNIQILRLLVFKSIYTRAKNMFYASNNYIILEKRRDNSYMIFLSERKIIFSLATEQ